MRYVKILGVAAIAITFLTASSCDGDKPESRKTGEVEQEQLMQRAISAVPTPQTNNFLTRSQVAKWMKRMDTPSKTFYVYLLADTGNFIGYYTAQYKPVSICTFLTPPDRVLNFYKADPVVKAPALDGVYYDGGGCDEWYFFDAATDALITIGGGIRFFVSDQPLRVDAEPISVKAE